ncbi:MAG: hypothetical protein ACODAQ_08660 [Phycisphaeraceae bacterium]
MPKMRAIPGLLLVAAFILSGAAPLCACPSMRAARETTDARADMPPCCAPQHQQPQRSHCPAMPAPGSDDAPDSPMPEDCSHCHIQSTEAIPDTELLAPAPTPRDHFDLTLDLDLAQPLPAGLAPVSLTLAAHDRHDDPAPPLRADSLLARACLLTL